VPQKHVVHDWVDVLNMQARFNKILVYQATVTEKSSGNVNFTDFSDPVGR
jgi:hypothetical protein